MKDMKGMYTKYFDITSTANKDTNLIMSGNYDTVKFSSSDESVISARGLAGAKTGNYEVSVEQKAQAASLSIDKADLTGDSFELEVGGQKVSVSLKDTNGDSNAIVKNINKAIEDHNKVDGATKIDVNVTSSELGGNIRIEGKKTGKENDLVMKATNSTNKIIEQKPEDKGQDAKVTIMDAYGNKATKEFANNKFVIDNVEYSVNGVSEKNTDGTVKTTKLSGKADASKIVENVTGFVEDYNKLIDKMNGLMGEKRDKSFMPLTEEQKKDMSESEIKLWEEKTKKGLLRNDDILYGAANELLGHITSGSGSELNLRDIGITPNADYRTQKGKITLDPEKLATAFENNGEETRKLLTGTFNKIKDTLNETAISSTSKIAKRAGATDGVSAFNNEISKKIELQQKEYTKAIRTLKTREDRYYSEFARLEVSMNKANAMMGQFMSMGGM